MILVDTNVLLRIADPISSDCKPARASIKTLRHRGVELVIARQTIYEFWAVATRPAGKPPLGSNGLGMSANSADQWLSYALRAVKVLPDPADLPNRWRTIVRSFNVLGIKSHDARLVAVMQAYNITQLLTFNTADFKRFHFITTLDPCATS
ncbi:MAG TPA: type II toxin-antitoxin system VapC family toxin [Phycisphaerae bacterium]|nr:type II toxin-antitoxin system VapC family toxin [Phycisphaerae bacterium]